MTFDGRACASHGRFSAPPSPSRWDPLKGQQAGPEALTYAQQLRAAKASKARGGNAVPSPVMPQPAAAAAAVAPLPPPPAAPAPPLPLPPPTLEAPAGGGYAAQLAAARTAKANASGAAAAATAPATVPAAPARVAAAAPPYAGPLVPLPESAVDRVSLGPPSR
jgi:hypothetical protein